MSDRTSPNSGQQNRTQAAVRRSWRPGWIWAIPVAALLIVAWLGIRAIASGGQDITIVFDDAHGLKAKSTSIMYRGVTVGTLDDVALSKDGKSVTVHATIQDGATQFLRKDTIFWLKGASPGITLLSSLGSILSGPTIEMEPGPGAKATHFTGMSRKPVVPGAHGTPQYYTVLFKGAVGSVAAGDPVQLRGFTVGEVEAVEFRYDAADQKIVTPVRIALYPELFHMEGVNSAQSLRAAVSALVEKGLRADLRQSPPLIGTYNVSLEMVPGAASATRASYEGLPEIPVAPGGGFDTILRKANGIPLDQIAQNVLDITHHVDRLVSSPKLADSVAQLDGALKQVRDTAAKTGPEVTQLVQSLRGTAQQLDQTAKSAQATLGGVTSQTGVPQTLQEVTGAARSLRQLADYLDRHPEALIRGRSD